LFLGVTTVIFFFFFFLTAIFFLSGLVPPRTYWMGPY
jgi:hypothetical protein